MKKSLKAFMNGIIDYAGLFPPADLSLDPAIRNFARYRKGRDADMLSRFIIPAGMLADLEAYRDELFREGAPFAFSVLGNGTEMLTDFKDEIQSVMDHCVSFHNIHGNRVKTDMFEIKLSKEAALSGDAVLIQQGLDAAAGTAGASACTPSYIFYEGFFEESWKNDIKAVIEAISYHNASVSGTNNYKFGGFKLRCGGVEAHMFPSVEQVAFSINMAREYNVAMKCTAGLHHPVRQYDDSVQTKMHGFINVFGGAMLAYAHDLNDEELIEILNEEDPEQFSFTDEAFSWRDLSISTKDLEELRQVALISFGSCSFDEPLEDLKNLKLLNSER